MRVQVAPPGGQRIGKVLVHGSPVAGKPQDWQPFGQSGVKSETKILPLPLREGGGGGGATTPGPRGSPPQNPPHKGKSRPPSQTPLLPKPRPGPPACLNAGITS